MCNWVAAIICLSLESLQGEALWVDPLLLAASPPQFFDQAKFCALLAWHTLLMGDGSMSLQGLHQKATKDFSYFFSRVTQAVQGKVTHEGAREALVHELVRRTKQGTSCCYSCNI